MSVGEDVARRNMWAGRIERCLASGTVRFVNFLSTGMLAKIRTD